MSRRIESKVMWIRVDECCVNFDELFYKSKRNASKIACGDGGLKTG